MLGDSILSVESIAVPMFCNLIVASGNFGGLHRLTNVETSARKSILRNEIFLLEAESDRLRTK